MGVLQFTESRAASTSKLAVLADCDITVGCGVGCKRCSWLGDLQKGD